MRGDMRQPITQAVSHRVHARSFSAFSQSFSIFEPFAQDVEEPMKRKEAVLVTFSCVVDVRRFSRSPPVCDCTHIWA